MHSNESYLKYLHCWMDILAQCVKSLIGIPTSYFKVPVLVLVLLLQIWLPAPVSWEVGVKALTNQMGIWSRLVTTSSLDV